MFRKHQKKHYPPGTFIPTPARVCAIIQLSLAFSILLWNASDPFVGEIFRLKSHLLLYQDLMGIAANDQVASEKMERLSRNAERFQALPGKTRENLKENMQRIQKQLQRSFGDKIASMFTLFIYKISPYELAWIFFSIVIPILLLKRVEGATLVVWILPLLTACYAVDSRWFGHPKQYSVEAALFPTEQQLVEKYIIESLSENVFEQQEQLMHGWKRYLIMEWTDKVFSEERTIFDMQAEEGEFNFNLARLALRAKQKDVIHAATVNPPPSSPLLLLYFFWNTCFACTVWKYAPGLKIDKNAY